jgi:hypothetical protein
MQQKLDVGERSTLHQLFGPQFGASRWGVEQGLKVMYAVQSEALRFATKRAHQNFEFFWDLTRCASAEDALRLHQSWCSEITADYGEQCGRMVGLGTDLASASLSPLKGLGYGTARAPEIRRAA